MPKSYNPSKATVNGYTEKASKLIPEKHIHFFCDLCVELNISSARGYQLGLDKIEILKNALEAEQIKLKRALRHKWYFTENPTLQIILYRLLATPEEHQAMNQTNKYQHSMDGKVEIDGKFEILDKNYQKIKEEFEEKLKKQLINTIEVKDEI